ncbi:clathrin adaptor complex small chain [Ceratobasidium sp. AG-Ba]|nr:clathrin adaptor complex small chain [Ceratobasidium sp. AG-Ba]
MSKQAYNDPPDYTPNTYPSNEAITQPVNFGDGDSNNHAYHASKQSLGASTELSYPQSKFNSGISVYDGEDPFASGAGYKGGLNERGETRAQALASEYRSSPIDGSPRGGLVSSASSHTIGDSTQTTDYYAKDMSKRRSVASNLDAMTYIDENYNLYRSPRTQAADPFNDNASLVDNAASPAGASNRASNRMSDLEYAEPMTPSPEHPDNAKQSVMARLLGKDDARYPLEQRIQEKRAGAGRQRHPFVVYVLSAAMLGVIIYELVRNYQEQGTPISFKPYVNPMLGPSSSGLINFGGRFAPCMKSIEQIPPSFNLGCMNNTANPPTELCTIETLCGFGGFKNQTPNQWFRFITPIFLHAGIIHYALNMFAQLTISAQVEREMGSGAFLILYFSAGIFGNVLGGNFALVGVPSVGASGAIFGSVAVMWVDLLAHWKLEYRPWRKLVMLIIDLIIGVALGFVPGVDNFAHLGGFAMGLLTAIVLYPVISTTRRHKTIMWVCRLRVNGAGTCPASQPAGTIGAKELALLRQPRRHRETTPAKRVSTTQLLLLFSIVWTVLDTFVYHFSTDARNPFFYHKYLYVKIHFCSNYLTAGSVVTEKNVDHTAGISVITYSLGARSTTMIHAVLIFNTHGTPRLAKFYTPTPANTRATLPRRIFELVSSRPAGLCNFLDAPGLLTDTGNAKTGELHAGGGGWEWEGEERELQRARVVYRLYATLYFVFVVDGAESELGVLDLIQVFVESLDRAFENVCELDLVFHFDEVHHILAELIQGGLVLETNVDEISRGVQERQKAQKASYAADNPLAAIGGGAVGGPRGGGLRGMQTPLGWLASRAFPTVGTR